MPTDRVSFDRGTNTRVYDRLPRQYPSVPPQERDIARFGCRTANSLLLLELAAARKIESGFDADWFEGEFLSRLRDAFFREPGVTEAMRVNFDWNAGQYEYESVDILALIPHLAKPLPRHAPLGSAQHLRRGAHRRRHHRDGSPRMPAAALLSKPPLSLSCDRRSLSSDRWAG